MMSQREDSGAGAKDAKNSFGGHKLEPAGALSVPKELLVTDTAKRSFLSPNITSVSRPSELLQRVATFMPKMEQANRELKRKLESDPASSLDIESLTNKDQPYVEISLGLVPEQSEGLLEREEEIPSYEPKAKKSSVRPCVEIIGNNDWSSDSDPDSPPSPLRPGHDNDFTSDSDSDSTISTSSSNSSNCSAPASASK